MNITEVYMLNDNLWWFYHEDSASSRFIQAGRRGWYLTDNEITGRPYPFTPRDLSDVLYGAFM